MRRPGAALLALALAAAVSVPLLPASPLPTHPPSSRAGRGRADRSGREPPESGSPLPGLRDLFRGDTGWSVVP